MWYPAKWLDYSTEMNICAAGTGGIYNNLKKIPDSAVAREVSGERHGKTRLADAKRVVVNCVGGLPAVVAGSGLCDAGCQGEAGCDECECCDFLEHGFLQILG